MFKNLFPNRHISHQLILLYGFHYSFTFIFSLAVLRDLYFAGYVNALINFSALSTASISYYFLHYRKKQILATHLIMLVVLVPLYILIYLNDFANLVVIYVVLLPLATFFLYSFKHAVYINILIYISLFILLYSIAQNHPDEPTLHNVKALINITFASILIISFGTFYHIAIESTLNKLIKSNQQKDLLLKEVHHRVKNNLNITASILGLQSRGQNSKIQEELLKSKTRIEAIALVHELLYKHDDFKDIPFNEYIHKMQSLLLTVINNRNNINIDIAQNNNLTLPLESMLQFGLIINELLTNSLKHADYKDHLVINISLQKNANKYHFLYNDSGIYQDSTDTLIQSTTLGIRLIKLSAKQLKSKLQIMKNSKNNILFLIDFD